MAAPPEPTASIDYLYIESNEGTSSGGHVALRFGDVTYDFQRHDPGFVRLERHDSSDLLYRYAFLQNRPVHASRIEVSDDTRELLLNRFNTLYLEEQARFDALTVVSEDRRLLTALAEPDGAGEGATIVLPGAGYFLEDGAASPILIALRQRVDAQLGHGWIEARLLAEQKALKALTPGVLAPADLTTAPGTWPHVEAAFSRRYHDARTTIAALDVLIHANPLRPDATVSGNSAEFALTRGEVAALATFSSDLQDDILELLSSGRNDAGSTMLVEIARICVLEESIRSGRLLVLDLFPSDARTVPNGTLRRSGNLGELIADAQADLLQAKAAVLPALTEEAAYSRLEGAANRLHELLAVNRDGRDLHVIADAALPERGATVSLDVAPREDAARWTALASRAAEVEVAYQTALRDRYAYDITGRNCVTEIFRTIELAVGGSELAVGGSELAVGGSDLVIGGSDNPIGSRDNALGRIAAASTTRLGGYIAPSSAAAVIPFVSAEAVNANYRVTRHFDLPSYREQRLAALDAAGSTPPTATRSVPLFATGRVPLFAAGPVPLFAAGPVPLFAAGPVPLRETNTLTSRIYRPNPDDSFFLLFADRIATRPLVGAVNLAASAGASVIGLATLPFRGFAPLRCALRGMMFSLPELAFVQIRRGSFAYVSRSEFHEPAAW